jgi:hypothetical protein
LQSSAKLPKSRRGSVALPLLMLGPMRAISVVVIAVAVCGCATDLATDDAVQASTTAFANDKAAFEFFLGKGLSPAQAAGIVGNLDQESGVSPTSVQAGGPGRGIAQWSVGGRWDTGTDSVASYASKQGESMTSLNLQLEFIWFELTTYGYGFTDLKAATNVTDATTAFMAKYEICGTCVETQRIAYAKSVLAAYGAIPWGATFVSQSWPLASQPAMTIACGQTVAATLVLTNTGVNPWNSSTRLGTTMPRDRASSFAGSDWIAPNRAAEIAGTVAPGAKGTFAFAFTGPSGAACVPGMYAEYFGIVQDGVAWFSDAGDGGPADDQLEALIQLVPGAATGSDGGSAMDPGSDGSNGEPGDTSTAGCSVDDRSSGALIVLAFALQRVRRRRR